MTENKTKPTTTQVTTFLQTVSDQRHQEALQLISTMQDICGEQPVMWGPSIIGFGSQHYKSEAGKEGDMPVLGFSPRKASLTVYFYEGFDRYGKELALLGRHKTSQSCLYINKLADIDLAVLKSMLESSHHIATNAQPKISTVEEYIASIPELARPKFDELRTLVRTELADYTEVLSYGIVCYKRDVKKRGYVFISGWKDHVAIYPVPKDDKLRTELAPYIRGKGTLWFPLDKPLPKDLVTRTIRTLTNRQHANQ